MCNGSRRDSQWTIVNPESPDNGNSYDTCSLHATSTSHAAFHTPGRSQWLASTDVRAINAGELRKCYTETNMMTPRHYSNTDFKQRRNNFVHNTTTTHTAVRESNTTHQSLHCMHSSQSDHVLVLCCTNRCRCTSLAAAAVSVAQTALRNDGSPSSTSWTLRDRTLFPAH